MALLSPKRQGSVRTRPGFVTRPEHSSSPWPWASVSLLYLHTLHTYIDKLQTQWKHCTHTPAHHNTSDVCSQIHQIYQRTICIYTHPTHKSTHHIHASYIHSHISQTIHPSSGLHRCIATCYRHTHTHTTHFNVLYTYTTSTYKD